MLLVSRASAGRFTSKNSKIYWYCQILGWSFYVLINLLFFGLKFDSKFEDYLIYFLSFPLGIAITHFYRDFVLKFKVIDLKIPLQIAFILFFSLFKAILFFLFTALFPSLMGILQVELTIVNVPEIILNYSAIFFLWNVIYFAFKYFQNYKKAEINSLKYLAASKESELNSLKSQLNPHFMFNCMNSIRALVDEDPTRAKEAITQLADILRNTILMNRKELIPFSEEMKLVDDYLNLEKIRYEERLSYRFEIEENAKAISIPPFIIQSQVENAIKHGVFKLPGNGVVIVQAKLQDAFLVIRVMNSGKLNSVVSGTGLGFANSVQRLELLYGKEGSITIKEGNNLVVVEITIPLK
jgi:two-component system, LytTR family, sensor kinase